MKLNTAGSLDIDDFESQDTAVLILKNPETGEPTTSTITLAGREHLSRKKIDLARTRKIRTVFSKTGKLPTTDPLDEIEQETDYLVASTLGWNLTKGGQPLPFSAAAVRELYTDPLRQWVREQVNEAIRANEIFIKASAKA